LILLCEVDNPSRFGIGNHFLLLKNQVVK